MSENGEETMMKAIICTKYGTPDVLEYKDVEKPVPNEVRGVLIKVLASSMNPADRYCVQASIMMRLISRGGLRAPKDPKVGTDVAGRVEAVSSNVTQFKPGDEVFGAASGAYAEYAIAREDRVALKPANCSFEEAGTIGIAGTTALQALRDKGGLLPGQRVLINGAGGGVGTFAVQIAKALGAEVTAVTNTENQDLVRKLGADHVIDYTKEDFTKNGQRYDLICDIAASHSISQVRRSLSPSGKFVLVGVHGRLFSRLIYYLLFGRFSRGKKFTFFVAKLNQKDFLFLKELIEAGKLKPVIDRSYPLSETGEAMKYLGEGRARGKLAIRIGETQEIPSDVQAKKPLSIAA
jgi:NADPH:quinone reductase-like Zn-dependent oxidoreductase